MTVSLDSSTLSLPWRSADSQRERISELVRTTQRLRGWSGLSWLVVLAVVMALGVAASTAFMIKHQHDNALARTTREIESVAYVLAHQADRTLQAVELVQRAVLDRTGELETPAQFRAALTGRDIHDMLRQRIQGLPQIDAVTTIDVDGNLVNFSRYWPIPPVNVADRDYFKALRAEPALGTFVSAPVRNRGTGTWTAYLARSVVAQDGTFLGLILIGLDLGHFEQLYQGAELGGHTSVALFRDDGVLLARHPHVEPSAEPVLRLRRGIEIARASGSRRGATYSTNRALDGKARLVAVVPLQNYPLGVSVTASRDDILAPWRRQATALSGAGLLLVLTIIGGSVLAARQIRAQHRLAEANLARGHAEAELAVAWDYAEAERNARARDARYVLALDSMSQGLCMFDGSGRLTLVNQRFEAMFALAPGAIAMGQTYAEVFVRALGPGATGEGDTEEGLIERAADFLAGREVVAFVHDHPDGRAWSVTMVPEGTGGWLTTFEDVTERRRAEARAAFLARHDALTGVANRTLFRERLEQALERSRQGEGFALLCIDLDRFKWVNDTLGHPVGDALLRAVTDRLRTNCRPRDTIARLGGDEFAVIQDGTTCAAEAMLLAQRLVAALSEPYRIDGQDARIGASIGIALIPADGGDATTLLKRADLALYEAKKERGRCCRFEAEMERAAQARPAMERALRAALAAREFEVHYQPVMDLHAGTLSGFEALVRWRHPERGLLGPGSFISLAEEIGVIRQIDAWVLRRACLDAAGWPGATRLSVNLSPQHFQGGGPAQMVREALLDSGLAPDRLELEITESAGLEASPPVVAMMHALKALGVRLAMADLGAGYSRLEYLRNFPLDTVKIDKSIVDDVTSAEKSRAIIDALGALCSRLGLSSTVEGVETEAQLRELRLSPCTNAQGYLFGAPRPAQEVPEMFRRLQLASSQPSPAAAE